MAEKKCSKMWPFQMKQQNVLIASKKWSTFKESAPDGHSNWHYRLRFTLSGRLGRTFAMVSSCTQTNTKRVVLGPLIRNCHHNAALARSQIPSQCASIAQGTQISIERKERVQSLRRFFFFFSFPLLLSLNHICSI